MARKTFMRRSAQKTTKFHYLSKKGRYIKLWTFSWTRFFGVISRRALFEADSNIFFRIFPKIPRYFSRKTIMITMSGGKPVAHSYFRLSPPFKISSILKWDLIRHYFCKASFAILEPSSEKSPCLQRDSDDNSLGNLCLAFPSYLKLFFSRKQKLSTHDKSEEARMVFPRIFFQITNSAHCFFSKL